MNWTDPSGLVRESALSTDFFTSLHCAGAFELLAAGTYIFAAGATTFQPVMVGAGWLTIALGLIIYYQECTDLYSS